MLARQRQEWILTLVRTEGGLRVSEIVEQLGISDMTARRDIENLARRGLLVRVHGGATAVSGRSTEEPGFDTKRGLQTAEKTAIARAAVTLVEPGMSLALSAGSTTVEVARALAGMPDLTVITNSLPAAAVLYDAPQQNRTVLLTGGVRTPSAALVGPLAVEALSTLHVDWLFMGVHGMDERAGFTTPNLVEAETNRALVRAARHVAVVADHSKWGVVGLSRIARLEDVDVIISDSGLDAEAVRVLTARARRLTLADPAADSAPQAAAS